MPTSPTKFLIVTPLKVELKSLLEAFKELGYQSKEEKIGRLEVFFIESLGLYLSVCGHGKTQAGIQTQFLLQSLKEVKGVICVGSSGGLDQEVKIGDVVLGSETIEHDFKLRMIQKPLPSFKGDEKLLKDVALRIGKIKSADFSVHQGVIASGDEDIIDFERAFEIVKQTQALAVAWEGAGCARACLFNGISFLEVRGITDLAHKGAPVDFLKEVTQVMRNIALCLVDQGEK